ncbi:MAG: AHH domain-containing protein, partial [Pseudomonadota bacterium]
RSIGTLLRALDEIMEMIIELGDLSKKARRRMTTQQGRRRGGTNQETRQDRDDGDGDGKCRICDKELGERGHPRRTPDDRDGITARSGSARRTDYASAGGRYSDGSVGAAMKTAQPTTHPIHRGVTMTHHHLLMINSVNRLSWSGKLKRLGYVIHDPANLVLMPNHHFGACHLEVQSHTSRHTTASRPTGATMIYDTAIDAAMGRIRRKIRQSDYCRGSWREIQRDMNRESSLILTHIRSFAIMIQSDNDVFRPGNAGCGFCGGLRDHGPGQSDTLRLNHPQQSRARAERIAYPKSGQWALATGR